MPKSQKTRITIKKKDRELTSKDHRTLKALLEFMMETCELYGDYSITAAGVARKAGVAVKGITLGSTHGSGIEFYYNKQGAKKKSLFNLLVDPGKSVSIHTRLKEKFTQPVYSVPSKKIIEKPVPVAKPVIPLMPAKSSHFIEGFDIKNRGHVLAYLKVAQEKAEAFENDILPKSEVTSLFAEFIGLPTTFGVAPRLTSFISQGALERFGDEAFIVKSDPNDWVPGKPYIKKSVKLTPSLAASESEKDPAVSKKDGKKWNPKFTKGMQNVLDDSPKMKGFLSVIHNVLAVSDNGYISRKNLDSLVKEKLFPKMGRSTIEKFVWHLVHVQGLLSTYTLGYYFLTEKAVMSLAGEKTCPDKAREKSPEVSKETKPDDSWKVLSGTMREAIENQAQMSLLCSEFFQQQKSGNTLYLKFHEVKALLEKHLLPGRSRSMLSAFSDQMIEFGYYERYAVNKYRLLPQGIKLVSTELPVEDQEQQQVSIPATSPDATQALVKALKTIRDLKEQNLEATARADASDAKAEEAKSALAEAEVRLKHQPDFKTAVQQEVIRLLSEA